MVDLRQLCTSAPAHGCSSRSEQLVNLVLVEMYVQGVFTCKVIDTPERRAFSTTQKVITEIYN